MQKGKQTQQKFDVRRSIAHIIFFTILGTVPLSLIASASLYAWMVYGFSTAVQVLLNSVLATVLFGFWAVGSVLVAAYFIIWRVSFSSKSLDIRTLFYHKIYFYSQIKGAHKAKDLKNNALIQVHFTDGKVLVLRESDRGYALAARRLREYGAISDASEGRPQRTQNTISDETFLLLHLADYRSKERPEDGCNDIPPATESEDGTNP